MRMHVHRGSAWCHVKIVQEHERLDQIAEVGWADETGQTAMVAALGAITHTPLGNDIPIEKDGTFNDRVHFFLHLIHVLSGMRVSILRARIPGCLSVFRISETTRQY